MQFNHPMRAVVLDDLEDEALSLMKAFSRMGIPSAHFHPDDLEDLDEDDAKRPTGVRLLGLDLDLLREGTTNVKNAVGSIIRLLRPVTQNGPFGLIIWSNHPDEDEPISQAIEKYCKEHKPNFKVYCSKSDATKDPDQLKETIIEKIKEDPSLYDLLAWESLSDRSASDAVREIANLATTGGLPAILTALANGVVGEKCTSEERRLRGIHEALAQIQLDIIEQAPLPTPLSTGASEANLSLQVRAELNSRLLLATPSRKIAPGSIYLVEDWNRYNEPRVTFDRKKDLWLVHLTDGLKKPEKLSTSIPFFMEVTPACDFAQEKNYGYRLMTGILYPDEVKCTAPYLKCIGPILYDKKPHTMVLYSKAIYAVAREDRFPEPKLRVRQAPLKDTQVWLSGMAARAGFISVR